MIDFLSIWKQRIVEKQLTKPQDFIDEYEKCVALYPEIRAEFGVFYTPVEVVNYIVENTIGEKIKEISPQIAPPNPPQKGGLNNGLDIIAEIAKLKIIDPACGSGSFLLGAYDFLLKWHLDFYTKNPNAPLPPKSPTQPSPQGGLKTPCGEGWGGACTYTNWYTHECGKKANFIE